MKSLRREVTLLLRASTGAEEAEKSVLEVAEVVTEVVKQTPLPHKDKNE